MAERAKLRKKKEPRLQAVYMSEENRRLVEGVLKQLRSVFTFLAAPHFPATFSTRKKTVEFMRRSGNGTKRLSPFSPKDVTRVLLIYRGYNASRAKQPCVPSGVPRVSRTQHLHFSRFRPILPRRGRR